MTDSINESGEFSQLSVNVTVCISVNIYCRKTYISLCYSFVALQDHNIKLAKYFAMFLVCTLNISNQGQLTVFLPYAQFDSGKEAAVSKAS